jgi:hypothetical protein
MIKDFQIKNNQINTANDDVKEYDAAKHNAVFYGYAYNLSKVEDEKHLVNYFLEFSFCDALQKN